MHDVRLGRPVSQERTCIFIAREAVPSEEFLTKAYVGLDLV